MSSAALGKVVEIGLDASADISEEVLARDHDAAPSVLWPEQRWLGKLLSTEYTPPGESDSESAPSRLCYALQGMCGVAGLLESICIPQGTAEAAGMAEPNTLTYIACALYGLGFAALALPISSAREALRPGGALEQLGVGEVMISAEDARSNARWRKGLLGLSALCVSFGAFCIAMAVFELPPFVPPGSPTQYKFIVALIGLWLCTTLPVAVSGWWASMRTASSLCRDEAIEATKAVASTDPKAPLTANDGEDFGDILKKTSSIHMGVDLRRYRSRRPRTERKAGLAEARAAEVDWESESDWDEKVAKRALGLRTKFELLSDDWSGGLIGFGGSCWLVALGSFTRLINTPWCAGMDVVNGTPPGTQRNASLAFAAIVLPLPFFLAMDVAHTSSWCDYLVEELNEARAKFGPASHLKIDWLETALARLVSICAKVCVRPP